MLAGGGLLVATGIAVALWSSGVHPAARQEVAGIGLATLMGGMMVVLLGNYLRRAAEGAAARAGPAGGQPSSVPTTDTKDTISPG